MHKFWKLTFWKRITWRMKDKKYHENVSIYKYTNLNWKLTLIV